MGVRLGSIAMEFRHRLGDGEGVGCVPGLSFLVAGPLHTLSSSQKAAELKALRIAAWGQVIVPPRADELEGRPQRRGKCLRIVLHNRQPAAPFATGAAAVSPRPARAIVFKPDVSTAFKSSTTAVPCDGRLSIRATPPACRAMP
jgi:hypothetical protein